MLSPLLSVARRAKTKTRYKILTTACHEGYQNMMGYIPHDFYMISGPELKTWDYHTRAMPANHYMYNLPYDRMRLDIDFDMILCQNRVQCFPLLKHIAQRYHLPIIMLDHTEPFPGLNRVQLEEVMGWRADRHIFITQHNKDTWKGHPEDVVIPHGIDTELFKGYTGAEPKGLSIVNHFAQRDVFCGWTLWSKLASQVPVELVGENPGLSQSINNTKELVSKIAAARFFLNTSQLSPIPLSLMEAMACGCPIVSTAKQEIPKLITHGVNGFATNDEKELEDCCLKLLANPELARKIGEAGRQTIIDRFRIDRFVENWNKVLEDTYNAAR